jgi:hypothetical protein
MAEPVDIGIGAEENLVLVDAGRSQQLGYGGRRSLFKHMAEKPELWQGNTTGPLVKRAVGRKRGCD